RLVALAGERGWMLEDTAELTGAANTLVRTGQQVQVANTDVRGSVRAIAPHLPAGTAAEGSGPADARATILGRAATPAAALGGCGAPGIVRRGFLVRTPERARRVRALAERIGIPASVAGLDRIRESAIVISTLPAEAGVAPRWDRPFTAGGVALDVAYAQDSAFLAAAAAHGLHPVDGTAMLVDPAVAQ